MEPQVRQKPSTCSSHCGPKNIFNPKGSVEPVLIFNIYPYFFGGFLILVVVYIYVCVYIYVEILLSEALRKSETPIWSLWVILPNPALHVGRGAGGALTETEDDLRSLTVPLTVPLRVSFPRAPLWDN